jgi:hypothetical protein
MINNIHNNWFGLLQNTTSLTTTKCNKYDQS